MVKIQRLLVRCAVGVAVIAMCGALVAEPPKVPTRDLLRIESEGVMVDFDEYGINMTVDKIPFSRHSQFHVKKNDWVEDFFCYALLRPAEETSVSKNRKKMTTRLWGTKSKYFEGTQTIELLPGRKVRFTVEGNATSESLGVMQIFPFSAEPQWFAGRPFKAKLKDGTTTEGVFTKLPAPFARITQLDEMEIDSSLGTVTIRTFGDIPVSFSDSRARTIGGQMQFICGLLGNEYKFPKKFTLGVEVEFGKFRPIEKFEMTATAPVTVDDAVTETTDTDHILPTPKHVTWGAAGEVLRLPNEVLMEVEGDATEDEKLFIAKLMDNTAEVLQGRMEEFLMRAGPGGKVFWRLNKDLPTDKIDYYRVSVTPQRATLEAPTTSGLVCAAATLRQLVRPEDRAIRCAQVEDWASMPMRGIHCFSGKGEGARDLQLAILRNVMGELKINTMLYECSYINWACRDAKHYCPRFGMDLKYAKDVIARAAAEFIEIIPMVNTMGHAEWLLKYDDMKHLSDDPAHPYAYDVTNPEVYRICDEIYAECIALFKPRAVHIGHDEVNLYNVYPLKPEAAAIGETELVLRDIAHWHKFLSGYGLKTWMWQDMLFHKSEVKGPANASSVEEAKVRRDGVDKDIVIVDWNYEPLAAEQFTGIETLSKEGFDNATATWYNLGNITNFAKATAKNYAEPAGTGKTLGMIHTTWAGYTFDDDSYTTERRQYASYAWAAEQMWNGGESTWGKEMGNTQRTLTRLMGEETIPNKQTAGFIIPLSTPAGVAGPDQLDLPAAALDTNRAGRLCINADEHGIVIAGRTVAEAKRGNRGVTKLVCPINKPVSQLCFIGAATANGDSGDTIANITVTYAKGDKVKIPVRLRYEATPMDDASDKPNLTLIEQGTRNGAVINLHSFNWKPAKFGTVKEVVIESTNHAVGWYLRGIVGLTE